LQRSIHVRNLRLHDTERTDRRVELLALARGRAASSAPCINPSGPPDSTRRRDPLISTRAFVDFADAVSSGIAVFSNTSSQCWAAHASLSSFCAVEILRAFFDEGVSSASRPVGARVQTSATSASGRW
jgi:hypothetical protein